jgi:DinB family protein
MEGDQMTLPLPVARLWDELQAVRADVLREAEGLSQRQADWRPSDKDWSVGEIVNHLTIAEIATGKLTTKLTREAETAGAGAVFPHDLTEFAAVPDWPGGPAEAPPVVWPEHGKPIGELIGTMKATRERSRQSVEKLATVDPRKLRFTHFRLGDLDLAQWWKLQAHHDGLHLAQIRDVKRTPGFPAA